MIKGESGEIQPWLDCCNRPDRYWLWYIVKANCCWLLTKSTKLYSFGETCKTYLKLHILILNQPSLIFINYDWLHQMRGNPKPKNYSFLVLEQIGISYLFTFCLQQEQTSPWSSSYVPMREAFPCISASCQFGRYLLWLSIEFNKIYSDFIWFGLNS